MNPASRAAPSHFLRMSRPSPRRACPGLVYMARYPGRVPRGIEEVGPRLPIPGRRDVLAPPARAPAGDESVPSSSATKWVPSSMSPWSRIMSSRLAAICSRLRNGRSRQHAQTYSHVQWMSHGPRRHSTRKRSARLLTARRNLPTALPPMPLSFPAERFHGLAQGPPATATGDGHRGRSVRTPIR